MQRTAILHKRCFRRWSETEWPTTIRIAKVLKPYSSGIPIEVSDDLNAYLDNVSNRKALKRFSDKSVNAWFRSRGYDKR